MSAGMMAPLCVNVKAAAAALGVSPWTVRYLIADGQLPVIKLPSAKSNAESNRRILIAVEDLNALVAKHREVAR
jgi:predicted site-specific integrase-resolvase